MKYPLDISSKKNYHEYTILYVMLFRITDFPVQTTAYLGENASLFCGHSINRNDSSAILSDDILKKFCSFFYAAKHIAVFQRRGKIVKSCQKILLLQNQVKKVAAAIAEHHITVSSGSIQMEI